MEIKMYYYYVKVITSTEKKCQVTDISIRGGEAEGLTPPFREEYGSVIHATFFFEVFFCLVVGPYILRGPTTFKKTLFLCVSSLRRSALFSIDVIPLIFFFKLPAKRKPKNSSL